MIDAIGRQRRLFGNSGLALHRARDPVFIHATLIAAHLPALTIYCAQTEPTHGEWLEKSFGSAGGSGVRVWDRTAAAQQLLATVQNGPADAYLQQRATGTSASAVFLASAGETFLIGISKQLVGLPEVHAAPFAYCGSIGPWSVSDEIRQQIEAVGTTVANACGLRGLFGCDFMIDLRTAWLTEVNPRYPASAEIFDHAWGVSLVDWHCLACMGIADKQSDVFRIPADHPNGIIGKLVIYAEQDIVAPQLERGFYQTDGWEFPTLADIPRAGTQILKGHPVCTVLAAGDSLEDCQRQLFKRVKTLQSRLACK